MHPADESLAGGPGGTALFQSVEDWSQLQGKVVSVCIEGNVVDCGRVDAVARDGSVLWLAMEGAAGRRLVENHQDINIQLHPAVFPLIAGTTD